MPKNGFELLLESLSEDERKAVGEAADKVPKLKDAVLAQSEFSRKMDDLRSKVDLADTWGRWRSDNWVDDQNMTRAELEKEQELEALRVELEQARQASPKGDGEMTFEDLQKNLDKYAKERGLVARGDVDTIVTAKEKELQEYVKGNTGVLFNGAMIASELNLRHFKEFGEPFDSEQFIKSATEKGRYDLRDYYEKDFVIGKRAERVTAEHKAEMDRVIKEKDDAIKAKDEQLERIKTQTMGPGGGVVEDGSPDLGPLQKQLMGGGAAAQGDKAPEVPVGALGIAAWAARRDDAKSAASRAA